MTLSEFISFGKKRLEEEKLHFSDSSQHMDQLVVRTLNWGFSDLLLKKDKLLSSEEAKKLNDVLERRLKSEPLQYILGFEYFYDSKFWVGPGCLIPRKETELLVDEILKLPVRESFKVAELGAGSGNIGISVLLKRPEVNWSAYEINPQSAFYTRKNQSELLSDRHQYVLIEADFFMAVQERAPFDLVVSNPPYVSQYELTQIPKEVSWEPQLALDGGIEGFDVILKLVDELPRLLKPNGLFLCEIGASQEPSLIKALNERGFSQFEILRDLAGLPRLLKLSNP